MYYLNENMISIEFAAVFLLICSWFFDNVYLVRCSTGAGDESQSAINTQSGSDEELESKVVEEYVNGNVAAYTFQGYRDNMEDAFDIQKNIDHGFSLFAVFDGHGGDFAAIYAKHNLIEQLKNRIVEVKQYLKDRKNIGANERLEKYINTNINYETLLKEEILEFDKLLIAELNKEGNTSGTTATIALIDEEEKQLWVANVGDSRAVMCDSEGKAVVLSFDHKVDNEEERKRIEEAGGSLYFIDGRLRLGELNLSRALGDPGDTKDKKQLIADPYIRTVDLSTDPPKFLILASDGLWDKFTNEEAVAFIQKEFASRKDELNFNIAENITIEAFNKKSMDNITVIVIHFS